MQHRPMEPTLPPAAKHCGGSPPREAEQAALSTPPYPRQPFHALASQRCLASPLVLSLSLPADSLPSGEHSNA